MSDLLPAAAELAVRTLLAEQNGEHGWTGELASSALATATAVSALAIVARRRADGAAALRQRYTQGVAWLAPQQNDDGGWGDTDRSYSNISTTLLVRAALRLAGEQERHAAADARAAEYVERQGGLAGLRRRYGRDKTFAVPILTNCALAELVDWREVSPLPFEFACVPQAWYRFVRLPVVSYAIPALVAIGQARFHHRPPWNPLAWIARKLARRPSLAVLERIQPTSGGYLEATPLTSFVVMSLASIGLVDHPVVERGVRFLLDSMRPDGSWPIDTNLATWNTTLAMNALAGVGGQGSGVREEEGARDWGLGAGVTAYEPARLRWVLRCQHRVRHPYTGAAPGGWAWTDLSGGVPDVDDTAGALLAIAACRNSASEAERREIDAAAVAGVGWLLDLQNRDGGWPTFCRGWGWLPFDRSGTDLTAHALRAIDAWRRIGSEQPAAELPVQLASRIAPAMARGMAFLETSQRPDGSWVPLWFGNQDHPDEENPLYGTAKVLLAYRDLNHLASPVAQRAVAYLCGVQNGDGGWGGTGLATPRPAGGGRSTIEETALVTEALLAVPADHAAQLQAQQGLVWLARAVHDNRLGEASPIGFYFARLWYYERHYPLAFTVSALGHAVTRLHPRPERPPTRTPLT